MNTNLILALAFLLLALEHFGVPIPAVVTGILFLLVAVFMLT